MKPRIIFLGKEWRCGRQSPTLFYFAGVTPIEAWNSWAFWGRIAFEKGSGKDWTWLSSHLGNRYCCRWRNGRVEGIDGSPLPFALQDPSELYRQQDSTLRIPAPPQSIGTGLQVGEALKTDIDRSQGCKQSR